MATRTASPIAQRGKPGRGITRAYINSAGHLLIQYDDDNASTQDAGLVDGAAGASVSVGNGVPAAAAGSPSDVYIDAVTGDIYRKEI